MMVGCGENSAPETYRLYNLKTKRVFLSIDGRWHVSEGTNAVNDPYIFDYEEVIL